MVISGRKRIQWVSELQSFKCYLGRNETGEQSGIIGLFGVIHARNIINWYVFLTPTALLRRCTA